MWSADVPYEHSGETSWDGVLDRDRMLALVPGPGAEGGAWKGADKDQVLRRRMERRGNESRRRIDEDMGSDMEERAGMETGGETLQKTRRRWC